MPKCDTCNKKIKLIEEITSKCKCGKINCGIHKLDHNCNYDYKNDHQKQIESIMIPTIGLKMEKI
jgi:hypothetical protein